MHTRMFIAAVLFTLIGVCGIANSATMTELRKIDLNRNGAIDAGEEYRRYLELERSKGDLTLKQLADIGIVQTEIAIQGKIPLAQLATEDDEEDAASTCDSGQKWYLRNDKIDVSIYGQSIDANAAEGAAISYTDNSIDDSQTAEIDAFGAFVFARTPCRDRPAGIPVSRAWVSGYAFALSVDANGNLTDKRTGEKSSLRPGLDAQIEIASGPFDIQALTFTPYYQTDFRGEAQAYGFEASWEPYKLKWLLGGTFREVSPLFNFFYQLKAEAIGLRVDNSGLTDLKADTDYLWLGGTAVLRTWLLPRLLHERLTWITQYNFYFDERSNQDIDLFSTALGYNFTDTGNTSVSLKYQKGTKRDTLEELDQYMVTLNAKY